MNPETRLVWQPIKRKLDLLKWHYVRLENRACGPGTPDLNVHYPRTLEGKWISGGDVWVELKYSAGENAKGMIDLGLRPEQYVWMLNASKAGRNVQLVARVGDNWYLWRDPKAWEMAKHKCQWGSLSYLRHAWSMTPLGIVRSLG